MGSQPDHLRRTCPICGVNKIAEKKAKTCSECRYLRTPQSRGVPAEDIITLPRTYEEAQADWRRWIGQVKAPTVRPPARRSPAHTSRLCICSDVHAPFSDKSVIAEMFEDAKDCDTLIVAGDVMDSYSLSRFIHYERVPLSQEMAETTAFLEQAANRFHTVLLLEGNHGQIRFEKQIRDRLSPDMVDAILILTGGSLSLLDAAAKPFPNVEVVKTRVGRFGLDWIYQHGDLVVCHAEKFSIVPGAAVRKIDEWLSDQEQAIGLKPWRVLMQAHTHQLGQFPWKSDRLLMETGCLCSIHAYQLTARIGGRPQRRGWTLLEQHNGRTDFDSIRMRWADARHVKAA